MIYDKLIIMQINQVKKKRKKRNHISNKSPFDNLTQTVPENTSYTVVDHLKSQKTHDYNFPG